VRVTRKTGHGPPLRLVSVARQVVWVFAEGVRRSPSSGDLELGNVSDFDALLDGGCC